MVTYYYIIIIIIITKSIIIIIKRITSVDQTKHNLLKVEMGCADNWEVV